MKKGMIYKLNQKHSSQVVVQSMRTLVLHLHVCPCLIHIKPLFEFGNEVEIMASDVIF